MFGFRLFVTGFKEIIDSILNYYERRQQNRIAFISEASEIMSQAFRRHAPKSVQNSDHAADHIRFTITDSGSKVSGKIQLDPEYSYLMFTVTGTKAHRIYGRPLRFQLPNNPTPHFAMFVQHPGTKSNNWMELARNEANPVINVLREKYGV